MDEQNKINNVEMASSTDMQAKHDISPSYINNTGLIDGVPLPTLMGFTTFVAH
jgi:hypothetical protein